MATTRACICKEIENCNGADGFIDVNEKCIFLKAVNESEKTTFITSSIEKVQTKYYAALDFRTRRRQANQEQAKQALTAVTIIQLAPS